MAYCTKQDLIDRFGESELIQLTDNANSGFINDSQLTRVIADIDGVINGYLKSRYTLPLTPVPPLLVRLACDLVRYDLYDHVTDIVKERYSDAMKQLRDIADGRVSLGLSDTKAQTVGDVEFKTPGRVFNKDTLKDF